MEVFAKEVTCLENFRNVLISRTQNLLPRPVLSKYSNEKIFGESNFYATLFRVTYQTQELKIRRAEENFSRYSRYLDGRGYTVSSV